MKFCEYARTMDIEGVEFLVIEAVDGQDAIDLYMNEDPDLIILDVVLPEKSGLEAAEEIKRYDPKALMVMQSTPEAKDKLRKALEIGVFDFIQKPIDNEKLKKILLNAIAKVA